jgi:hypothetical protein
MQHFKGSIIVTILGLIAGGFLGWFNTGTIEGVATTLFIVAILAVLEVSLSFDNAVVNAAVLEHMDELWRRRFLTWGIAIAVFGMRIVFPLLIVAIIAQLGPIETISLVVTNPDEYSRIITSAHVSVAAFGGSFLAMVGLKYFFDIHKTVHWIELIERPLTKIGRIEAVELGLVMLLLWLIGRELPNADQIAFYVSGMLGLVTYIAVDGISAVLDAESIVTKAAARSGAASFLYLEVLDASFSFDGVIGAFALSSNLFIITIGLGIGAMFVRSLTIMLVSKGTLAEYRYLKHGAFYAIVALGVIMFVKTIYHIPEALTGLIGAVFILLSLWDSMSYNKKALETNKKN